MSGDYKDEFAGQGGSYTVNKDTGKRELAHRTEEPKPKAPAEGEAPAPAERKRKGAE